MPDFSFTLNNEEVSVTIDDPKTSSLEVLRETLGVHTCKAGCSPQGLCGCCTALIDGKPRLTCTLPVKSLAGKSVTTMDGLPADDRALLADSFVRAGGTQCGYCTPGIVLNAWSLLQANAAPTHEEITRALNQHLCRCTGYTAIYAAIERAAAVRRGDADPLAPRYRPEGADVTCGDRPYVDDLERPGLLYGGVVFAPVAVGQVDEVATDVAETLPGVRAVRVLKGAGSALAHAGEPVVAIAAESPAALRAAQAAVAVKATARPARVDAAEAPVVAEGADRAGDVDAALAGATHRATAEIALAPTDPVFLEPEAVLVVPVTGGVHVYSPGHDASAASAALSAALGVPARVFLVPSGGSYGGKTVDALAGAAGALALATGAPVRMSVGMEAGMRLHPRRPAARVVAEAGCDADGRLVALRVDARVDGGAGGGAGAAFVDQALGALAYVVPARAIVARVVATDNPAAGLVRGGAGVGVGAAIEAVVGQLAAARGEDGVTFRRRNLSAADAAVLDAAVGDGAGVSGVAVGRAPGAGGARVVLSVVGDGEVEVACNLPELGQGRDEALANTLARVTGLAPEVFTIAWTDSSVVGAGAPVWAPVEGAAEAAGRALVAAGGALAGLVGQRFVGEAPAAAPAGVAVAVATLGEGGEVTRVRVAGAVGAGQDARVATNLLEGAGHMGLGIALSEEVETKEGLAEGRLRFLGVLKPKGCARFEGVAVAAGGAPRDVAEAAVIAVPAAVAQAIGALEGRVRAKLPMKDTAAAKHVGVRPPKPAA